MNIFISFKKICGIFYFRIRVDRWSPHVKFYFQAKLRIWCDVHKIWDYQSHKINKYIISIILIYLSHSLAYNQEKWGSTLDVWSVHWNCGTSYFRYRSYHFEKILVPFQFRSTIKFLTPVPLRSKLLYELLRSKKRHLVVLIECI